MREFQGDLLIGGAVLRQLHGELEEERPEPGTREWLLAGQLHLSPHEGEQLRISRPYRLELNDGKAGQVVVTRVTPHNELEVIVDFQHLPRKPK